MRAWKFPQPIAAAAGDIHDARSAAVFQEWDERLRDQQRIEKTKSAIASAENIPADRKAELLDLLSKLKPAIAKVSETHHEDAKSIARLVEASAHETICDEKKPERTNRLLRELKNPCKILKRRIRSSSNL